jgi:hypothetical protein
MKNNKKISDLDLKKIFENSRGVPTIDKNKNELELINKRIQKETDKVKKISWGVGVTILSSVFLLMIFTKETSHIVSSSNTNIVKKEVSVTTDEIDVFDEAEENVEYAEEYLALLDSSSEL